jgi:hypothetical protein
MNRKQITLTALLLISSGNIVGAIPSNATNIADSEDQSILVGPSYFQKMVVKEETDWLTKEAMGKTNSLSKSEEDREFQKAKKKEKLKKKIGKVIKKGARKTVKFLKKHGPEITKVGLTLLGPIIVSLI